MLLGKWPTRIWPLTVTVPPSCWTSPVRPLCSPRKRLAVFTIAPLWTTIFPKVPIPPSAFEPPSVPETFVTEVPESTSGAVVAPPAVLALPAKRFPAATLPVKVSWPEPLSCRMVPAPVTVLPKE